jgi:hypothetical protein
MEISLLEVLLKTISTFLHLSKDDNISSDPVQKYYQKAEEILKLLKPIFDAIVDSEVASDEVLNKDFLELGRSVDELREIFESWQPLSSKVYFVSFRLYFCDYRRHVCSTHGFSGWYQSLPWFSFFMISSCLTFSYAVSLCNDIESLSLYFYYQLAISHGDKRWECSTDV